MMPGHGANSIAFNKKIKIGRPKHLLPPPLLLRSISSQYYLTLPPPLPLNWTSYVHHPSQTKTNLSGLHFRLGLVLWIYSYHLTIIEPIWFYKVCSYEKNFVRYFVFVTWMEAIKLEFWKIIAIHNSKIISEFPAGGPAVATRLQWCI